MSKKPVIVFEGIVGSGKSHHINTISKYLKIKRKEENKLQVNEERAYNVLDELKVSPNIWYMRKIRNKKES